MFAPGYLDLVRPVWLWALPVAVAIPVVAHLVGRPRPKALEFPTARFVQEVAVNLARSRRVRRWRLLALRAGLLGTLIGILTQPVWRGDKAVAVSQTDGSLVTLVVDRSASMNRSGRGGTLLDEARQVAVAILQQLDPLRDVASVVVVDRSPSSLLPRPTANLTELIRRIGEIEPSYEGGDVDAALRLAESIADRGVASANGDGEARLARIELISDMQAGQMRPFAGFEALSHSGIDVVSHRLGQPDNNLALTRPRLTPPRPIAGHSATLTLDATYWGVGPDSTVQATISVRGGTQRRSRQVVLTGGQTSSVSFDVVLDRPGVSLIEAMVQGGQPDALAADDRTGLFVDVLPGRQVDLITNTDSDDPTHGAYYFKRALVPTGIAPQSSKANSSRNVPLADDDSFDSLSGVKVNQRPPGDLAHLEQRDGPLAHPAQTLVIVEANGLTGPARAGLYRHLRGGGTAIWVLDGYESALSFQQFAKVVQQFEPSSPAILADGDGAWHDGSAATIAGGQLDHPVLAVFEGASLAGLIDQAYAGRAVVRVGLRATRLLDFEDGHPMLAICNVSQGQLAVICADVSPQSSTLVKTPFFVPLVHQLIRHLCPVVETDPLRQTIRPGDWLSIEPARRRHGGRGVAVTDPTGRQTALSAMSDSLGERVTLPGPYRVVDQASGRVVMGAFAEVDPVESDLREFRRGSGSQAGRDTGRLAHTPLTAEQPARRGVDREAQHLWPFLVSFALVLMSLEPVVAWGWIGGRQQLKGGMIDEPMG